MQEIATQAQMINIAASGSNVDGDLYYITGNFIHDGVKYISGDEVFWLVNGFEKVAIDYESAMIILAAGNTSESQDGNFRVIVGADGRLYIQKLISGSWSTRSVIS